MLEEYGLHISAFWAEKASEDLIKDWPNDLNCRTIPKEVASVAYGLGVLRDGFRDNSNTRSLFIDKEKCPGLHSAISKKYKCKKLPDGGYDRDRPDKPGEDYASALRYAYVGGPKPLSVGLPQEITVSKFSNKYGVTHVSITAAINSNGNTKPTHTLAKSANILITTSPKDF